MTKQKSVFYNIRRRIKDSKTNRKLTQKQFADILGFDKSTVAINEKKGHIPSFKFAYTVSKLTGVSLDDIAKKTLEPYFVDSSSVTQVEE